MSDETDEFDDLTEADTETYEGSSDFENILSELLEYDAPATVAPEEAALSTAQERTTSLRKQLEEAEAAVGQATRAQERADAEAKVKDLRWAVGRSVLGESFATMDDEVVAATAHELALALEEAKVKRGNVHHSRPLATREAKAEVERLRTKWAAAQSESDFRQQEGRDRVLIEKVAGWQKERDDARAVAKAAADQVASIQASLADARASGNVSAELRIRSELTAAREIAERTSREAKDVLPRIREMAEQGLTAP